MQLERLVAFDFETSGEDHAYALQPWRALTNKAWATSLVTVEKPSKAEPYVVKGGLNPTKEMMREMLVDAIDNDKRLVGWNTVFDIGWLIAYGLEDLVMKAKWLDGMLLWKHVAVEPEYSVKAGGKKTFGLKTCVAQLWPEHANYEENVDFHNTDPEARALLHEYNIRDSLFTLRASKHWWAQMTDAQQRAALYEADALPLAASADVRGILIDTLAANELASRLYHEGRELMYELQSEGVTEEIVRSPTKLSDLMFNVWKLQPLKVKTSKITSKTTKSTDAETLYELGLSDTRPDKVQRFRDALTNRTKFALKPIASVAYNGDYKTHPQAKVFGTYSGRMTYGSKQLDKSKRPQRVLQTGFALHQEKRGEEYRSIIIAPRGYTIMEFDASGQEFRWMAIASEDETMLKLCLPGEDPHSFMGAAISKRDYRGLIAAVKAGEKPAKGHRQVGKVANLSLQYRTSPPKLRSVARVQYDIPMELKEAEDIRETYLKTYKGVPSYWARQIHTTQETSYVETFAGRRVQVGGNWGTHGWSMGSTAINYRIQGTGADQKFLALSVIKPYLTTIGAHFAWDLHDGLYFYVPDHMVERAAVEIKAMLDNLPYQEAWGFTPPIPLPWDAKYGASWGTLKEYDFN
jgi:DNA polymerase I-like protein with 3'-5' exonuclease and polymerase domains